MVSWIRDFVNTYRARTGRPPIIYTTTSWWVTCTGNNSGFGASPLWIARYGVSAPGTLPAGWSELSLFSLFCEEWLERVKGLMMGLGYYTFWQFADSGVFPGDQVG